MTNYEEVLQASLTNLATQGFKVSEKKVSELPTRGGGENVLQDGDEFSLPDTDNVPVLEKEFNGHIAYSIPVIKKNGTVIAWYHTMMSKTVTVYDPETKSPAKDKNGALLQPVTASGDAVDEFRKYDNVGEFVAANKGKTIKVESHQVIYTCIDPNNNPQYRSAWVYRFVFKK